MMKRQKIRKFLLLFSFLLFPVTLYYFSPVLIIQGSFSGIVTGSLILFAIQFVVSLFWGRAFCGWVCPGGSLQEYCSQVIDKKVSDKKTDRIKWIIWMPWIFTIIFGFISQGGIKSVNFFYMTDHGISVSGITELVVYLFFVFLITVLALTVGKRGMCHSICWMAPFMILGSRIKNWFGYPSLHLEANSEKCVKCGVCSKNCPMGLNVEEMVRTNTLQNDECILCGGCADLCAKNVLRLTFKKAEKPNTKKEYILDTTEDPSKTVSI